MKTQSPDTPPEIEKILIEGYRRMSPRDKLDRVVALSEAAEAMAAARIRSQYGSEIPKREMRLRLAALQLDRETMTRIFDWDPEERGY